MGRQEFTRMVAGSSGDPVRTNVNGSIETNNYQQGDGFDFDGTTYPYTVDPAFNAEVLQITESGDIDAEITTTAGNTFTVRLAGGQGTIDWWTIASVTFRDPRNTGKPIRGAVGGDA